MKNDNAEKKKENIIEEQVKEKKIKDKETKKNEELEERLADFENKYKRALADYQNLEKRILEERSNWIKNANKELILRFLPVLDTLMLANNHIQDKGLTITIQQFLQVLEKEGVDKIETEGKEFDPNLMECTALVEGEEGKVIQEIRAGYTLHGSVIRPAQVTVGSKS